MTTLKLPIATLVCLLALFPLLYVWKIKGRTRRTNTVAAGVGIVLVTAGIVLYPVARISVAKPARFAPMLTDEDAKVMLQSLHKNVYRAFDFREEQDVYDKLAICVNGELLNDIYLQSRKSLPMQKAGGAQTKVKEVDVLEAQVQSRPGRPLAYTLAANWTALGTVGHWGHVHMRKNRYDALVTIDAVDRHWKITALEVLEEHRSDPPAPVGESAMETRAQAARQ